MVYVGQIMMLYTWNLYGVVCQLSLNKIGREKKSYFSTNLLISPSCVFFKSPTLFWIISNFKTGYVRISSDFSLSSLSP